MNAAFQPQIILLREGTDTSQGKAQIVSNINACQAVAETVKTTLGPRGMDKLVFDGQRTTISNDGATIMRLLDIVHPAAKTLVDISMAQVRSRLTRRSVGFCCMLIVVFMSLENKTFTGCRSG
jgi:T-complex protein 1 subunit eta